MDGLRSQRKGKHISRRPVLPDVFTRRLSLAHRQCGQEVGVTGIAGRKPGGPRRWAGSGQRGTGLETSRCRRTPGLSGQGHKGSMATVQQSVLLLPGDTCSLVSGWQTPSENHQDLGLDVRETAHCSVAPRWIRSAGHAWNGADGEARPCLEMVKGILTPLTQLPVTS